MDFIFHLSLSLCVPLCVPLSLILLHYCVALHVLNRDLKYTWMVRMECGAYEYCILRGNSPKHLIFVLSFSIRRKRTVKPKYVIEPNLYVFVYQSAREVIFQNPKYAVNSFAQFTDCTLARSLTHSITHKNVHSHTTYMYLAKNYNNLVSCVINL